MLQVLSLLQEFSGLASLYPLWCRYLLKELQERVRQAIALPVRIAVTDVFDETCTQLLISAPIDSGALRV